MSGLYDYKIAEKLLAEQPPVDALIMAAYLRADASNQARIEAAFPALAAETRRRFNAPGGRLDEDNPPSRAPVEIGFIWSWQDPPGAWVEVGPGTPDHIERRYATARQHEIDGAAFVLLPVGTRPLGPPARLGVPVVGEPA